MGQWVVAAEVEAATATEMVALGVTQYVIVIEPMAETVAPA